jgi:hypothetical protein
LLPGQQLELPYLLGTLNQLARPDKRGFEVQASLYLFSPQPDSFARPFCSKRALPTNLGWIDQHIQEKQSTLLRVHGRPYVSRKTDLGNAGLCVDN